jgi:type II secretory pathway pseudopilin PulG
MKGFSLIEALLALLIIVFLAALIFPLSLNFYKNQQLQTHSQQILQTLRRAQLKAMAVEQDSSFGVYITNDNYTLFKGNSYATRDSQYDEVFDLPQIITVQGAPREAVFSKFEGKPARPGNIVLSNDGESQTININGIGRIGLE